MLSTRRFFPARTLFALIASATALMPAREAESASFFTTETITPSATASMPSLAMAGGGDLHLAFQDDFQLIYYATRHGGSWTFENVGVGQRPSLALDSSGEPHLSVHFVPRGPNNRDTLIYTRRAAGLWPREVVAAGPVGPSHAIAMDAEDVPHIVYRERWTVSITDNYVKHARRVESGWDVELAAHLNQIFSLTSRIDALGRLHIASMEQRPYYLHPVAGGWIVELVEGFTNGSGRASMAVDGENVPHLSYGWSYWDGQYHNHDLHYARRSQGTWIVEEVDTAGRVGALSAIAVDASGTPRIAYPDAQARLVLARKDMGAWMHQIVDEGVVSGTPAIVLDSEGRASIVYATPEGLKLAVERRVLPGRAFLAGANRVTQAWSGLPQICVQVEGHDLEDLEPGSLTLGLAGSDGTPLSAIGVEADRDRDRNGVAEVRICFRGDDAAGLLESSQEPVEAHLVLRGALRDGDVFAAPLDFSMQRAGGASADRLKPAELREGRVLRFESRQASSVPVRIYDLHGRLVSVRGASRISGARFEVNLEDHNASLAPGIYFYRVDRPEGTLRGRFVVID